MYDLYAYVRQLEDQSGFIVAVINGNDKWEEVLGLGDTPEEAIADAKLREAGALSTEAFDRFLATHPQE